MSLPLDVTLFADFTCPYSYVTEAGLVAARPEAGVRMIFRAFELAPSPDERDEIVPEDPQPISDLAAQLGLDLRPIPFRPPTRKAHEASVFARLLGLEPELRLAIYRGYWSDGLDIGRIDVLADLGGSLGIDREELRIALDIDRFAPEVLHDLDVARRLGIPGTPTFFLGTGPRATVVVGSRTPAELEILIRDTIRKGGEVSKDG